MYCYRCNHINMYSCVCKSVYMYTCICAQLHMYTYICTHMNTIYRAITWCDIKQEIPPGSPLANRRSIEGDTSCWSPVSSPLVKRRSVEIGGSPLLGRRKQEANLEPGGGCLEVVGRARDSGNLHQPVLLLASLDKSILQIRWGNKDKDDL